MNSQKKVIFGISILFLSEFLSSGLAYLLRLLLTRTLTIEEYGIVYTVISLFGLFFVFQSLGLRTALSKYIAEFRVDGKNQDIKNAIISVFTIESIISVVIGAGFIVFSDKIAVEFLHNPSTAILIQIYALGVIISPVKNIFHSIFQGFQRMDYYAIMDPLKMGFILVVTGVFLFFGFSVLSPIIAYSLANLIALVVYVPLFVKKVFPEFTRIKTGFDKELIKKLFKFGIPVAFMEYAILIFVHTDTIMIAGFRSLEEVGLYQVGMPTSKILWNFSKALMVVMLPLSSQLYAEGRVDKLKAGVRKVYRYSVLIILPVSVVLAVFAEPLLDVIFPGYGGAVNVLRILSLGAILFTLVGVNNSVLMGIGKPWEVSKIMMLGAGLNVIGNLLLIPVWGIDGAAVSMVGSYGVILMFNTKKLREVV